MQWRRNPMSPAVICLICAAAITARAAPTVPSTELGALSKAAAQSRRACGPRALSHALARMGYPNDPDEMIAKAQPGPLGTTIKRLVDMAEELGAPAMAVTTRRTRLAQMPIPAILVVDKGSHCVVLEELDEAAGTVRIFDPEASRSQVFPLARVQRAWTGDAIIFDSPYPSKLAFYSLSALVALAIAGPVAYLAFGGRLRFKIRHARHANGAA